MRVLDNSVVSFEIMPDKSEASGSDPAAQPKVEAIEQASSAKDQATGKAQEPSDQANEAAMKKAQEPSDPAEASTEDSTSKPSTYKEQARGYQSQASDSFKGYATSGEQTGHSYLQSGSDAATNASTSYLPMSAQGYARAGVDYATNAATGAVTTASGEVANLGDAIGNPGTENVTRLGKTGYNAWNQVGGAVMGSGAKAEAPAVEQDAKEVTKGAPAKQTGT